MTVFPHPLGGVELNFVQVGPLLLGQPLVAHRPVKAFKIGILQVGRGIYRQVEEPQSLGLKLVHHCACDFGGSQRDSV